MSSGAYKAVMMAGALIAAGFAFGSGASAQDRAGQCRPTPPNFSWDYDRNCNRVPKSAAGQDNRQEARRGGCVEVKEKTPEGVRTIRRCD